MQKNNLYKFLQTLLVTILLQGCSTLYYGHSKVVWDNFSEDEQIAIRNEYQFIFDSQMEQKHKKIIDARTQSIIDRGVNGPGFLQSYRTIK